MNRFCVLFLAILAGTISARASLGDNADVIEDRYGTLVERHSLDDGTVSIRYHKDRYLYFVIFDQQRSVLERYSRTDGAELSEKEISRFLKANAGGPTWTPDEKSTRSRGTKATAGEERRFERSDHKAEAIYRKVDERPTLEVRAVKR